MSRFLHFTRRQFIKSVGAAAGIGLAGLSGARRAYAAGKSLASKRLAAVYKHDAEMPTRKSQDNPEIAKIYKDFLGEPNSEKAHHLLHTEYVDRSAMVKALKAKGVKLKF